MHMKQARGLSWVRTSLAILLSSLLLSSCALAPSQDAVHDTIQKFFEDRKCRVIELQIGSISALPLDQKTYMGTAAHIVEIRKITLEISEDVAEYRKGELLTFTNGSVSIREKVDAKNQWIVVNISGIRVP
jgi:hypothetical protein